ncbi:MAG: hypothetical protein DI565_00685 [Ancylobacter novellus]|uniref:Uncharacterized protein n=1 Tax=Ancylobacter novellus TaxID=921 RepID=A0A2W5MMP2_ANCNO|nr:MAG: hypothetical protein DI565_00685 [Ancylobacter novellus]
MNRVVKGLVALACIAIVALVGWRVIAAINERQIRDYVRDAEQGAACLRAREAVALLDEGRMLPLEFESEAVARAEARSCETRAKP